MTLENVTSRVIDIVSYSTKTDRITIKDNTNLFADIGIDSLDFLDLMMEIEKVFGIDMFKDKRASVNEFSTIGELANEVYRLINKNVAVQQIQEKEIKT